MARRAMNQPERQAWALSYALRTRPSPALASLYFESLKRMLVAEPTNNQNTVQIQVSLAYER